jgi:hypothetical protein
VRRLKAAERQLEIQIIELVAEELAHRRGRVALQQIVADEVEDRAERGDEVMHAAAQLLLEREVTALLMKFVNCFSAPCTVSFGAVIFTRRCLPRLR